jgi:hypothetical protein
VVFQDDFDDHVGCHPLRSPFQKGSVALVVFMIDIDLVVFQQFYNNVDNAMVDRLY